VCTIAGSAKFIEGSGRANILLAKGTNIEIKKALYSPKAQRNLLSFSDIRSNGYHIETANERGSECLYITCSKMGNKNVLEKLVSLSSGLYYTKISTIEAYALISDKFVGKTNFIVWHDRLGHPGSIMMRKIIKSSCRHSFRIRKF